MSDQSVPETIVKLIIEEIKKTVNNLGSNVETCSTNMLQLTNKLTSTNITKVYEVVHDMDTKLDNRNEKNDATHIQIGKVHSLLSIKIPAVMTLVFAIITVIGYFFTAERLEIKFKNMQKVETQKIVFELQEVKLNHKQLEDALTDFIKIHNKNYILKPDSNLRPNFNFNSENNLIQNPKIGENK